MSGETSRFRRILIALDSSPPSLWALRAAAELAARAGADLAGVFVEDVRLLRVAALGLPAHVSLPVAAAGEALEASAVEAQYRVLAAQARRALAVAAEPLPGRPSLRVVRGSVVEQVLAAAETADLLVVGWSGWGPLGRPRLGSTAWDLLQRGSGPVLLLPSGADLLRPVLAVVEAGGPGEAVLERAIQIASTLGRGLRVLAPLDTREPDAGHEARLRARLDAEGVRGRLRVVRAPDRLGGILRLHPDALLVLSASSPLLAGPAGRTLLESLACPVLAVR